MSGFSFLIVFALSCVLFPCEGGIISPAKGTNVTFLPGTTANITWIFDDAISSLFSRTWFFTRKVGTTPEQLAIIIGDSTPVVRTTIIPAVKIETPGTLLLKNVNQSHNGKYEFDLSLTAGQNFKSDVTVFIAKKPNLTINCSSLIKLNEGDEFTCLCRGEGGNPPADVTWYKNGTQFGKTKTEDNTLTRTDVDETDNITYTCFAQSYPDPLFEDSETVVVQVKFKPKDTTIELTQNPAKLGTSVTIKCKSRGFPEPSYYITLNGTKTVSTEKTYTISKTRWNDTGTYNCTATNERGSDWEAKFFDVTEQGPTPATSTSKVSNKTGTTTKKVKPKETTIEFTQNPATVGTSVTIKCESRSFPEPSYTITLNGTKTVSTEKTYTISKVGWNDTGSYNCTATNERGSDWAAKFLDVSVQACSNDTSSGTEWYIVVVILVSGIIIGFFLAYIVWCSSRRWFTNRKPERNTEPQTNEADTTYQELDLSKMNAEDNYQSLRVNAACIDAGNDDDSTYTELKKGGRDDENNYQSLT